MKEILFDVMGDRAVVIEGDASVGARFFLPFDHLFFTGSIRWSSCNESSSENLTPVTFN